MLLIVDILSQSTIIFNSGKRYSASEAHIWSGRPESQAPSRQHQYDLTLLDSNTQLYIR